MLLSRLRVPGAKLIATTNPDSPQHWLKREYIDRMAELDMLTMRFLLEDNTTLDPQYVAAVKAEYTGVFYRRFILGEWCVAEGLIYPMFDKAVYVTHHPELQPGGDYYISCDYGTLNPTSAGLWYLQLDGHAIRLREYYYDGRKTKTPRTDEEHYKALEQLAGDVAGKVRAVIVDPSAASFIECIRRHGLFRVWQADNSVLNGIRDTSSLLQMQYLHICDNCTDIIREFSLYRWDESATEDCPIKENDHAMDDMRYFVRTAMTRTLKAIRRR